MISQENTAGRSDETTVGVGSSGGTAVIRFGTNRKRVGPPDLFSDDFEWGPNDPRYLAGTLPSLGSAVGEEAAAAGNLALEPDPKKVIRDFLDEATRHQRTTGGRDRQSLVFIHGFNCKFTDLYPITQVIAQGYGCPHNLVFSWPSFGDFWHYKSDRDHAYASGQAAAHFMLDLLDELATRADPPKLSLACHSMGNRVMSAIVQFLAPPGAPHPKALKQYFDHILLFAADEDYRALQDPHKLQALLGLYKHSLNIYTNGNDVALTAGQAENGMIPELGQYGPYGFPLLDSSGGTLRSAFWLNCTGAADSVATYGHQYFRLSQAVISDARHVLEGMAPDTIPGRDRDGFDGQKFTLRPA